MGKRNENGGLSPGGDFSHRRGPGPADQEIRPVVCSRHVLYEGVDFRRHMDPFIGFPNHLVASRAGLVDEIEPPFQVPEAGSGIDKGRVDGPGPLAPSDDKDGKPGVPGRASRRRLDEASSDRVARYDRFPRGEERQRLGKGNENPAGHLSENPVRQARHGVLFSDGRGNPHEPGRENRGTRGVAPHPENQMGLKFLEDIPGGREGGGNFHETAEKTESPLSPEARNGNGPKVVTLAAQDPRFDAPPGAHEKNLRAGDTPAEFVRHGHTGKEVASRSPAGDDHPERGRHHGSPPFFSVSRSRWEREMFIRMPMTARETMREVPP